MKKIQITDIKNINTAKPLYILIAGAIGAGKSTVVSKYLPTIEVVDPDIYTMQLGRGVYDEKNVATSMAMVKSVVNQKLSGNETFIQQGTSANLQSSLNKMMNAQKNGFTTILLYIDTPLEKSIENVANRKDRNIIPSYKVKRTHDGALLTYQLFTNTVEDVSRVIPALQNTLLTEEAAQALTDYTIHYKNFS